MKKQYKYFISKVNALMRFLAHVKIAQRVSAAASSSRRK